MAAIAETRAILVQEYSIRLPQTLAIQELQKYLNIFGGIFVGYFLLDLVMSGSVCFSNGWRQAARQIERIWNEQNALERLCVATNEVRTVGGFILYTTCMCIDAYEAIGRKGVDGLVVLGWTLGAFGHILAYLGRYTLQ
jgi:hypothetical protein